MQALRDSGIHAPSPENIEKAGNEKRYHVYSTLSCSQTYCGYRPIAESPNDSREVTSRIVIHGGANVVKEGFKLHTPRGVLTSVTSEQMRELMANEMFQLHLKGKFITVDEVEMHPEKMVSKGMTARDNSSQIVPQDFMAAGEGDVKPMEKKPEKKGFIERLLNH